MFVELQAPFHAVPKGKQVAAHSPLQFVADVTVHGVFYQHQKKRTIIKNKRQLICNCQLKYLVSLHDTIELMEGIVIGLNVIFKCTLTVDSFHFLLSET